MVGGEWCGHLFRGEAGRLVLRGDALQLHDGGLPLSGRHRLQALREHQQRGLQVRGPQNFEPVFRIRIQLNPDPAKNLDPDPDPEDLESGSKLLLKS